MGYHLSWDTYEPSMEWLTAIRDFRIPTQPYIADVRLWFGLVNQLAPLLANAPPRAPFRDQ